jgi:hypothetical protein
LVLLLVVMVMLPVPKAVPLGSKAARAMTLAPAISGTVTRQVVLKVQVTARGVGWPLRVMVKTSLQPLPSMMAEFAAVEVAQETNWEYDVAVATRTSFGTDLGPSVFKSNIHDDP